MTWAICRKCGHAKFGAFRQCTKCGFLPDSPRDQAEAILLSDHHLSKKYLEAVAERIMKGQEIHLDELEISEYVQNINESPRPHFRGCTIVWWILLTLMFSLLVLFIYLIVK